MIISFYFYLSLLLILIYSIFNENVRWAVLKAILPSLLMTLFVYFTLFFISNFTSLDFSLTKYFAYLIVIFVFSLIMLSNFFACESDFVFLSFVFLFLLITFISQSDSHSISVSIEKPLAVESVENVKAVESVENVKAVESVENVKAVESVREVASAEMERNVEILFVLAGFCLIGFIIFAFLERR